MRRQLLLIFAITLLCEVLALNNGLALTPPMGWNSWNHFGCNINCTADPHNCISETLFMQMADAMVSSGMKAAGYEYINMDDCWLLRERDANGRLQADPERFPSGISALATYIHSKGLKFGIYGDSGNYTCENFAGGLDHELIDAQTYAEWGVDYVKLDGCWLTLDDMPYRYALWSKLLNQTNRPMVFSCSWPAYWNLANKTTPYATVAQLCNLWREYYDIQDTYESWTRILDYQDQLAPWAGPGHWNDPDMLEVGNGGQTTTEYQSLMSLWAILAAPLIAGNDLRNMTSATLEILTNSEVIAVDQDPLGQQGHRIYQNGSLEIWARNLTSPSPSVQNKAIVFFNRGNSTTSITATLSQLGYAGVQRIAARDLWAHRDLGTFTDSFTAANLPPHGVQMIKTYPVQ